MLWNKTYGGAVAETPFSLIKTIDGGYGIAGRTYSYGAGEQDFWFITTDSAGNMLINQTYGGEFSEIAHTIIQTSDGGYAIAGITASFGQGENDFWLIKTDQNGIIPEFPSWTPIVFFTILLTATSLIFKRKLKK